VGGFVTFLSCLCASHSCVSLQAALDRFVGGTSRVPLLGWLSGRGAEILLGVQRYYTYIERMAGS
jgi:hypothetical protein